MRFAISDGERVEATPGARGVCPGCGSELIARCGERKVWHWAHKGRKHCDPWWENETEWHRAWKNNFPVEWQEIPARDGDGELHIADIKTPKGLVVEFQHSYIKPEEARKRTEFHQPMFWVVDGTRRPTDPEQFAQAVEFGQTHRTPSGSVHQVRMEAARLLRDWSDLGIIVVFDFGDQNVWVLRRVNWPWAYGFQYPKEKLVEHIREGSAIPDVLFGKPQRQRYLIRRGRRSRY